MKCLHDTIVQPYLTSVRGSLCGLCTRTRREATMALETWIMVGDAGGIEPASRDLRAPTRPMARAPTGNAKTHSTPSQVSSTRSFCRRRRRRRLLGRQAAGRGTTSSRRPRHHIRRRLRRAARCVGAFAAAPHAKHARALSATGTSRPDLGVRAQLHRSARASRRGAAKGPRAGRWQVDRWEQLRPPTRARAWSRHSERAGGGVSAGRDREITD